MVKKYPIDIENQIMQEAEIPVIPAKRGVLRKLGPKRIIVLILIVVAVTGVYGSVHYYNKYKALTVDANAEAAKETERLVGVLGKLMELPTGETPTIATISDKEKLSGQPFFAQSENGDILFAYTTAMKAILYRPSTNKIINVAPITINQQNSLTQGTSKTAPAIAHMYTVAYYNGTEISGLAASAEKLVNKTYQDYKTVMIADSSLKNYTETLVVDLSGTHSTEVADLAKLLGGKVGALPQGETKPNADILIISGR